MGTNDGQQHTRACPGDFGHASRRMLRAGQLDGAQRVEVKLGCNKGAMMMAADGQFTCVFTLRCHKRQMRTMGAVCHEERLVSRPLRNVEEHLHRIVSNLPTVMLVCSIISSDQRDRGPEYPPKGTWPPWLAEPTEKPEGHLP